MPTVLVVEDDPVLRRILTEGLVMDGFDVVAPSRPRDAVNLVDSLAVDVVVCDVRLGPLSGPDLVRQMRKRRPGLLAVFTSGQFVDDLEPGDELLMKPFELSALASTLGRLVGR